MTRKGKATLGGALGALFGMAAAIALQATNVTGTTSPAGITAGFISEGGLPTLGASIGGGLGAMSGWAALGGGIGASLGAGLGVATGALVLVASGGTLTTGGILAAGAVRLTVTIAGGAIGARIGSPKS